MWSLLLALCLGLPACGVGFGAGEEIGEAELVVTRDFGAEVLAEERVDDLVESDTVLRVLDRSADIETRYGGGFVQSIDGLSGGTEGGAPFDWLYFVNGLEADRGSAEVGVLPGDAIWWDYRNWSVTASIPAVVGQFPAPFADEHGAPLGPVALECVPTEAGGACAGARDALEAAGAAPIKYAAGAAERDREELGSAVEDELAARVVVGTWEAVSEHPVAERIAAGPERSGVYLRLDFESAAKGGGPGLLALDESGEPVESLGKGVGVVAATRSGSGDPVWFVTGTDDAGLKSAVDALEEADLEHRFAALATPDRIQSLPMR